MTAHTFIVPFSLLTTSNDSTSPPTSATTSSARPVLATFSRIGSSSGDRGHLVRAEQDVGAVQAGDQALHVRDEVGGRVAPLDLRPFGDLELGLERRALLDVDDAVEPHLTDGVRDQLADAGVAVGADRRDLGDVALPLHGLRHLGERRDDALDADVDAALEGQRMISRRDELRPLLADGVSEHGGGSRPVAGGVARLDRALEHELGAHVRERLRKLDLLRDRHAVLGHERRAVHRPLEHDRTAAGPQRRPHRAGEDA